MGQERQSIRLIAPRPPSALYQPAAAAGEDRQSFTQAHPLPPVVPGVKETVIWPILH